MAGNGCNAPQYSFFLVVADGSNIYTTALPHHAHHIIHLTIHFHVAPTHSGPLVRIGGHYQHLPRGIGLCSTLVLLVANDSLLHFVPHEQTTGLQHQQQRKQYVPYLFHSVNQSQYTI